MYSLYRQLHPPTGIELAIFCNFISHEEKNLILAGVNQMYIYRFNQENFSNDEKKIEKESKVKLECLSHFTLFGNIVSMQSVQIASCLHDALLLSFKDAKLSLVEYDEENKDLKTISLHHFEDDELKDGHVQQGANLPIIRKDGDDRCAVMLIFGFKLVVLPFSNDSLALTSLTSYVIDLKKLDDHLSNVIDFQFLHGYYEPTVVILFEALPTWTGRISMRKDTCCIVAISLNIEQRVHPIIWSANNLPFDALRIVPVPKPIGGILVFCVNSLIYLNQSFPAYGVSLNSITNTSTDFLLKIQDGIQISLDCCQSDFISYDKLVISLKCGELYVLTLITDSMKAVRSFHFDRAASSVLTTCVCACNDNLIFLASRLGNSILLRYQEKVSTSEEKTETSNDDLDNTVKKRKLQLDEVEDLGDLDELEVYGIDTSQISSQIARYSFEVCDSILNIGPCGQTVMGDTAFLSEEFLDISNEPDIELVTTSGYNKNGAISILQRSIRPQLVTTFELPGCIDMWTVVGGYNKEEDDEDEIEEVDDIPCHSILILSKVDTSMVLKSGKEIMELDHSGFITQAPTVFAGNIGNNKYIIQVTAMGVRLLEGAKNLQHIALDEGSPICCCSLADPYLVLLTEKGRVIVLTFKPATFACAPRMSISIPKDQENSKVVAMCTYMDSSGLFSTAPSSKREQLVKSKKIFEPLVNNKMASVPEKKPILDEDDLLYGETLSYKPSSNKGENKSKEPEEKSSEKKVIEKSYWLLIARENGNLEIFSMPDHKLCFLAKNFPYTNKILNNYLDNIIRIKLEKTETMLKVKELLLVGMGNGGSKPYLIAIVNNELIIYEAYQSYDPINHTYLKVQFKKVLHTLTLKGYDDFINSENSQEFTDKTVKSSRCNIKILRPFDNISGYSGVFVCGSQPHWIMMTQRGILRFHPMTIDGGVTCFTSFHNINCPKGFLYFNAQNELRISMLPMHLNYDSSWPVRKIPLRATPYYIAYHLDSKMYAVVTSVSELCNKLVKIVGDNEKEIEILEKDDRFLYPFVEKFSIQLFSPLSWESISQSRFNLDDFERVTCMQTINLRSEGTVSGLKGYIVCGTNYTYTEDISSKGRIIIMDVIEVVPEPGLPLTKNKFKIGYNKEQKGGVSAVSGVNGFLVSAIGQKIYIWQLRDNDLIGVAFIDAQIYVNSIVAVKNLLLIGDVYKSITLLRYQEEMKVLSLVSRDIHPCEVYSLGFLIHNEELNFLVSDSQKNALVFSYLPEVKESHGGQRLLKRADIQVGGHINTFFRIKSKNVNDFNAIGKALGTSSSTGSKPFENIHVTYFSSLDGALGYFLPLSEKMYRRLLMLQNIMNTYIVHLAGLNPKAYRLLKTDYKYSENPHKNILDGDLIFKFLELSYPERKEISSKIGVLMDQILNDLIEIERSTSHF